MKKAVCFILSVILMLSLFAACSTKGDKATGVTVLKNATVYTVAGDDWAAKPAEAIAFDESGKILAVGTADDVKDFEAGAEVKDLQGKAVFPGFLDAHAHVPGNAVAEMYEIDLSQSQTKEDSMEVVKEFIDGHPDMDAYFGAGFSMGINPDSPNGPKKEWLDEICSDKAIVISSLDVHSFWLNTKAFEEMSITKDTKLENGSIPVDPETGELWGVVTDGWDIVTMSAEYSDKEFQDAISKFQEDFLAWGFTGLMAVAPYQVELEQIKSFVDSGSLKLRMNLSGSAEPIKTPAQVISETDKMKKDFAGSALVTVSAIKFFEDGVVEGMTAYLKEPYAKGAKKAADYVSHGNYKADNLKAFYVAAYESGYQIHTHSIGDAGTSEVLDALAYARDKTKVENTRDVITHLQLVTDADKKRMAEMKVIGDTQPFWHLKEPEWYDTVDEKVLGKERAESEYPVKSMMDAGVLVTFSSDYPVSPVNNPFWAIEVAVTRNLENPDYYGVEDIKNMDDPQYLLNAKERITLSQAIEAYTRNAAYQLYRENENGTLEVGKFADLIVTTQDPFKVDPIKIDETAIDMNYIGGKLAWSKQ